MYYWAEPHNNNPFNFFHLKQQGDTHAVCGLELGRCFDGVLYSEDQCFKCKEMASAEELPIYPGQVKDEPGYVAVTEDDW